MKNIDMSSEEFLNEIEKTKRFTEKVNKQFGWVPHPNHDVNEGVIMGLARHKMLYGKRFCPCYMVIEDDNGKHVSADNRTCPCKTAIEKEVPEDGMCHCGIFCTPEFAEAQKQA